MEKALGRGWKGFGRIWDGFGKFKILEMQGLKAKLSSRDQVGYQRSLPDGLGVAWERQDNGRRWDDGGLPDNGSGIGRRLRGAPMQLPSRRGGCASSRFDHGFKV